MVTESAVCDSNLPKRRFRWWPGLLDLALLSLFLLSVAGFAFNQGVEAGLFRRIVQLSVIPNYQHRPLIEGIGSAAILVIILVICLELLRLYCYPVASQSSKLWLSLILAAASVLGCSTYYLAHQQGYWIAHHLQGISDAQAQILGQGPQVSGIALMRVGDLQWIVTESPSPAGQSK